MSSGVEGRTMGRNPHGADREALRALRLIFGVLIVVLCSLLFVDLWNHPGLYQEDLRAYYFAGKAYIGGLDPYSLEVLSSIADRPVIHGFVYTPLTLPVLGLLSRLPYLTLYRVALVSKLLCAGFLMWLWSREFIGRFSLAFVVVALIAFDAPIYVDMRVGNLAIYEQVALWVALVFFLRKRLLLFVILILSVAALKITPILLLCLLFFSDGERRISYFGVSAAAFLGLQLASYFFSPRLFASFVTVTSNLSDRGVVNPSSLGFIQDVLRLLGTLVPGSNTAQLAYLVYFVVAAGVSFTAARVLRGLPSMPSKQRMLWCVYIFCLTYGVLVPRFKTYSYMIVLVPTYFIFCLFGERLRSWHPQAPYLGWLPLLAIVAISSIYVPVHGTTALETSFLGYSPLAALVATWLLFMTGVGLHGGGWLFSGFDGEPQAAGPFVPSTAPHCLGGS